MARTSCVRVATRLIRSMHAPALNWYAGGTAAASRYSKVGLKEMVGMGCRRRQYMFWSTGSPNSDLTDGAADSKTYPLSVSVEVAYKLHKASSHRYLDVRTRPEFDEGHASGAVNIPYLISTEVGMSKNPNFLEEVASELGRDDKIIVGCRSGKRSLMAVEGLRSAGYSNATNIEGGYMAWPDKEPQVCKDEAA
uniref:Rhodanese domain-containing protein n=1 Tax=Kalanchoe fedtschenkoi TaxID=63787 RepID=A0A7N0SVG1_KALFE